MIPIIQENIAPNTTIYSDQWRAYNGIGELQGYNYQHLTVNHTVNFVDPISGAHTNTIEGLWGCIKTWLKTKRGVLNNKLPGYMDEYMFRANKTNKTTKDVFWKISLAIYERYSFD